MWLIIWEITEALLEIASSLAVSGPPYENENDLPLCQVFQQDHLGGQILHNSILELT